MLIVWKSVKGGADAAQEGGGGATPGTTHSAGWLSTPATSARVPNGRVGTTLQGGAASGPTSYASFVEGIPGGRIDVRRRIAARILILRDPLTPEERDLGANGVGVGDDGVATAFRHRWTVEFLGSVDALQVELV